MASALRRKLLATAALLPWLATLALVSGPIRWELQHSYAHLIEGVEQHLPQLTRDLVLPILGLGERSLPAFAAIAAFWGVLWLWPLVVLVRLWRAGADDRPTELLGAGSVAYLGAVALLFVLVAFGLWLPFLPL